MTTISTLSLTSPLRQSVNQAQAALTQAQTEVSSGTYADLGLQLGARTGQTLSFESDIDSLNNFTTSNASATTRLAATSNALTGMLSSAQSIQSDLITASSAGGTTSALAATATGALQGLISGLNTSAGGQSVFGGINSGVSPIADYFSTPTSTAKSDVETAFQTYLTNTGTTPATITGAQMTTFLHGAFSQTFTGSNGQWSWSSASSQTISSTVAPSQTLTTSVSANQSSFQQIAQAYTMLTEFTGSSLNADAQAAVVSSASALMSTGIGNLTNIQAGVGAAQAEVSTADTQLASQVGVLQTNVSDATSVDTYALSSQVTALQTQLEASYELTSRLQSLSLVNYLPTG